MDEVFVGIGSVLHYLWRAVDQNMIVLDVLVLKRNGASAKRFFKHLLLGHAWLAQLRRGEALHPAEGPASDQPIPEQPC